MFEVMKSLQIKEVFYTVKQGDYEKIEAYLIEGLDINITDKREWTLLHYAARSGSIKITKLLVDYDANIHAKTYSGVKPLHIAALFGRTNLIEFFILKDLNINDLDNNGWTPLHYAGWSGRLETIKFLLDSGADANAINNEKKKPLDLAHENGYHEVANLFNTKPSTYLEKLFSYVGIHIGSK